MEWQKSNFKVWKHIFNLEIQSYNIEISYHIQTYMMRPYQRLSGTVQTCVTWLRIFVLAFPPTEECKFIEIFTKYFKIVLQFLKVVLKCFGSRIFLSSLYNCLRY